jgi:prephenate dehydrogenase
MHHAAATPSTRPQARRSLGLIGAGAFGAFIVPHLLPFFDVAVADPGRDGGVDIEAAAARDIVVLAVPLAALEAVVVQIAPRLKPGAIVVDVCSVKMKPLDILRRLLPEHARIVGTHPLFGPQSGRNGLPGLSIAVCGESPAARLAGRFFSRHLGLEVVRTDAERHDRQMAYVQGVTHLLARIVLAMDIPEVDHPTQTFRHLQQMVEMVRHDSDELFRAITTDNPFAEEVLAAFWSGAEQVAAITR